MRIVRALSASARDRLPDPPGGVGGELEAFAVVELLGSSNEPDRPLLDEVEEGQALVSVVLCDRDDQAKVRLDHLLLGAVVAALDPLRELDLLRSGQERHLADVLEEELERVGRDLGCVRLRRGGLVLLRLGLDDLDVELVELLVELVDLNRVQLQFVERERDLLLCQEAGLLSLADERLRGVVVQRHAFPSMPSPLLQADPSL
jgi:hypothetical protein